MYTFLGAGYGAQGLGTGALGGGGLGALVPGGAGPGGFDAFIVITLIEYELIECHYFSFVKLREHLAH